MAFYGIEYTLFWLKLSSMKDPVVPDNGILIPIGPHNILRHI